MAQTEFSAKQMGKQALVFGISTLIVTFLLSCIAGLLTAGGLLPESALQILSAVILCICVFAGSFLAAKAAPGKKLIVALLVAVVYWAVLAVFSVAAYEQSLTGILLRAAWVFGVALVAGFLASARKKRRKY
ncbi:MAG: TIGR04086 family membrane protein [Clostridiales bacterium]|nr:TIGR04086 family membrane protein [Clostridiales bacterium]